jgi:hypothetical protein
MGKEDRTRIFNFLGAQELNQWNQFRRAVGLAGRYDNPLPTRFRAPIDCLKIPALLVFLSSYGPYYFHCHYIK